MQQPETNQSNGEPTGKTVPDAAFLRDKNWWRAAVGDSLAVVRHFAAPAAGVALSNIIAIAANVCMTGDLMQQSGSDNPDITRMLLAIAGALAAVLFALGIAFAALWIWLQNLTALARSMLSGSIHNFSAAVRAVAKRKKYLLAVWLFGSLYLLVPAIPLAMLMAVQIASRLEILGQPALKIPDWAGTAIPVGLSLLSILILAYSLVLLVLSSTLGDKPKSCAAKAMRFCIANRKELAPAALIASGLHLLTAPQLLLVPTPLWQVFAESLWLGIACQLWFGFTSVVIWPLSVLLICRTLEPCIEEPGPGD